MVVGATCEGMHTTVLERRTGVKMRRLIGTTVAGMAALALLGCGNGESALDTVPVSGVVTLDGTPVEGANVVFAPTSGSGTAASGVTDASGRYQLTTQDPNDGALAGSYVVMISKTETEPSAAAAAVKPGMSAEEATKAAMEARDKSGEADEPQVSDKLPAKYKDPAASGFKAEVSKGGQTEFNFELTSE